MFGTGLNFLLKKTALEGVQLTGFAMLSTMCILYYFLSNKMYSDLFSLILSAADCTAAVVDFI